MLDVQSRITRFVVQNFYVSDPAQVTAETSLISTGLVDSTGMLEIIAFLEGEFGIRIADQEMIPENLETVARIASFVERKRAANGV